MKTGFLSGMAACSLAGILPLLTGCVASGTGMTMAPTLQTITLTPTDAILAVGAEQQFRAIGTYSDTSTKDLTSAVTWTTNTAGVVSISGSGVATAVTQGTAMIWAAAEGMVGQTTIAVAARTLISIAINPTNVAIASGTSQQFSVTGTYNDSSTSDLTGAVTWATNNAAVSAASRGNAIDVGSYGAIADSKLGYQCSITAGSSTMQCSDVACSGSDVGSTVYEYGSNAAQYYLATPGVTVRACGVGGSFELSAAATRAVSGGFAQILGGSTAQNTIAIQNALNDACTQGNTTISVPPGVYSSGLIRWPIPCAGVRLTGNDRAVIIRSTISSDSASQANYGLSGQLLAFGTGSEPGKMNNAAGNSIAAGSNQLNCAGCRWTAADVGSPIYVESGGAGGLPLWATIMAVNTSSATATLSMAASTTLPLPVTPVNPPAIIWGFAKASNIIIDSIGLEDVSYYFQPGFSQIAIPVVEMGVSGVDVKQNVILQDVVIASAGSGCYGNNGPVDQFQYNNDVCRGGTDASWYFAGQHSNGSVDNMVADNTGWPYPKTPLFQCWLVKGSVAVTFQSPVGRCAVSNYIMNVADAPNFQIAVIDANFDGEGVSSGGVQANFAQGLSLEGGTISNLPNGNAIELDNAFGASAVNHVTIENMSGTNDGNALDTSDASGTGHGAANIVFTGNVFSTTGNGANAEAVEGANIWSQNSFTGSGQGAAWQIYSGATAGTNSFCENTERNYGAADIMGTTVSCNPVSDESDAAGPPTAAARDEARARLNASGGARDWTRSLPTTATAAGSDSEPGLFVGGAPGTATITATMGSVTAQATLNVTAGQQMIANGAGSVMRH